MWYKNKQNIHKNKEISINIATLLKWLISVFYMGLLGVLLEVFSNFYFPMQNFLKILPSTSSVVMAPVMVPRW